jgi:hypothetical protein
MYWDVVEVMPKANYSLFVRFKDGLEGLVHLRREQLTGALEPLRDESFFEQVFIDEGAVAWPGEIDPAPDAMCAGVSKSKATANSQSSYDSARLNDSLRVRATSVAGNSRIKADLDEVALAFGFAPQTLRVW